MMDRTMADEKQKPAASVEQRPAQAARQAAPVQIGRPRGIVASEDLRSATQAQAPRGMIGKVQGKAERPKALPMPANRNVGAYTKPEVFEKWDAEAAGIRAVERGDNVITMFGPIGEDFWTGDGVTAKAVTAQLRAIGPRPVEVQINSPGGDMFEGIAIYNVLREHAQDVTVRIMGLAASAASVIAMAGNTIEIGAASFIMIHNCSVMAAGNRHDFQEVADFLAPFDAAMAELYAQRTGSEVKDISKWMDAETFMSGTTAIERGFADTMLSAEKIKVDDQAKTQDHDVNKLRAMELRLMRGGETRAQARAHVQEIRGTTDSAPPASTTDSAGKTAWPGVSKLIATIQP